MKFLHTADWHIGKELGAFSLLSEQWQAFRQMVTIAEDEAVDGIIIAGDLYDRGIPPLSAVEAFEDMARIMNLEHHWPIYAVSGNHDGAVRLGAGREWRETTSFYLHTTLAEAFEPVELADTQIFMLPFLDPLDARIYYQMSDEESRDYTSIEAVMARIIPDLVAKFKPGKHHILVTHYNVIGTGNISYELTSETNSQVGGLKGVPASLFADFDYVALGHIHLRQASPTDTIRYAGSPVKFNTKEAQAEKGVYIVEVGDTVTVKWRPIQPVKDLIVIKGTFSEITAPAFYEQYARDGANWFSISLTDFPDVRNARGILTTIYGDIVEVNYVGQNAQLGNVVQSELVDGTLSDQEIISHFYETVAEKPLSAEQVQLVETMLTDIGPGV